MRWFAAFWITLVLCFVGMGFAWIGRRDLPVVGGFFALFEFISHSWFIIVAVLATYLVVRLILQRAVAYTESAIDGSPRESRSDWSRRRAAIGLNAYRLFGNPTGRWLSSFALVLAVVAILAGLTWLPVALVSGNRLEVLGLTLVGLYAYTVGMAMRFPDRPIRLRPEPEAEPDRVLDLPEAEKIAAEDPDEAAAASREQPRTSGAPSPRGRNPKRSKPPKNKRVWFWRRRQAPRGGEPGGEARPTGGTGPAPTGTGPATP